jgi:flagellar motor switch protein FliG
VAKSLDQDAVDFATLRRVDPQQLAKFIQDEHPQTIALVLSHLDPSQAAALIWSLPVETRTDVAVRMANLEQISPESVRTIASVIGQKLRNLGEVSRESYGGVRAVADMFNRLDTNSCSQLMDAVEKEDPALFESVRRYMFVFEDLAALDPQGIKELLSRVDRKILVLALKGTSEELQRQFMAGMSQRGAEMLREDMSALGPVKIKEVDAAQQQVIVQARQLEKEGVISLKSSPSEQYIN